MNYIDIILGLILIFSAIGGFKNGLITELASLAALILGIWGAIHFSDITTELLIKYFDLKSDYLNIISFGVTFIVIVILVHIVGNVVNNLFDSGVLGITNKLGGMVFGFVRSILFLSIVLMVFDKIDNDVQILPEDAKSKSRMYEPIRNIAPSIFPFIDIWNENQKPNRKNDIKVV
ncbi:MAG TPA: CvpA family protein [Draconibacterium sp.]|nr:CvpA family protein [Draconibacterium sp.]